MPLLFGKGSFLVWDLGLDVVGGVGRLCVQGDCHPGGDVDGEDDDGEDDDDKEDDNIINELLRPASRQGSAAVDRVGLLSLYWSLSQIG